jgi:putative transposase
VAARTPFAIGQWYHCYSRGVDKRATFLDERDFERFMQLLYLANDISALHHQDITHPQDFSHPRSQPLVAIAAYALMPNHYHLVMREIREGGISEFMRKLGIAYTTYFNTKNERVGNLFVKPFRARHVDSDRYLQHLVKYIHLNAAELFEPRWKEGDVRDFAGLEKYLIEYPFASLRDFNGPWRPAQIILDSESIEVINPISMPILIHDAYELYQEFAESEEP